MPSSRGIRSRKRGEGVGWGDLHSKSNSREKMRRNTKLKGADV